MSHPLAARVHVGCAGWSLPRAYADRFPAQGSHLERYAGRLPAVEINSSFYRPHRPSTYARWAAAVPDGFRFSVKVPREITHKRRLVDAGELLDPFLTEALALGDRLGPLLVQLPPSLALVEGVAGAFFAALRARFAAQVACEPRHPSWFTPDAERLLSSYHIARVAADPAVVPAAAEPGGWDGLVYHRLHGSPRVYYSAYPEARLVALAAAQLRQARTAPVWCIFDNTALGAATDDALALLAHLGAAAAPGDMISYPGRSLATGWHHDPADQDP